MWIHFSKSNYGSYGGGLNEPFLYFGRIISDRLKEKNIEFPFEEIEIQLATFSQKGKKNEEYTEWYKKLPYYYRGKKMLRVTLPVEKEEDNLTEVFMLIHKAFETIISKKKKDDNYDSNKLKSTLLQLEEELKVTDLWQLNSRYENILRQEAIEKRLQERAIREKANDEKKKLVSDLRFDYRFTNIEKLYFAPYANRFCNKILEKLREKKFRLPNYTHLYIMVSDSFENALYHSVRVDNWFVYGVAILENYVDYATMKEVDKKRIVFDLIKQGLNDIAKIDKLDSKTLNDVLEEVEHDIFKKYKYLDENK